MENKVDTRRLIIFLAIAFGIAWLVAGVIYFTGGLKDSPVLAPGLTLAFVLLTFGYMLAPALANVLTRLFTREGWRDVKLRPNFRAGLPFWAAAWVLPGVLTLLGTALFFVVFPGLFDSKLGVLAQSVQKAGIPLENLNLWTMMVANVLQAIVIAPLINGFFTFGEEFGWRAYLLPRLLPLGERKAVLYSGVIWGVWHAPIIAMGHNYGFGYFGAPLTGILMMIVFCVALGTFLSWATLRAGSVWPAVIGHGAINGIAAIGALMLAGEPNTLLGPAPTGIIGMLPWLVLAGFLYLRLKGRPDVAAEDLPGLE